MQTKLKILLLFTKKTSDWPHQNTERTPFTSAQSSQSFRWNLSLLTSVRYKRKCFIAARRRRKIWKNRWKYKKTSSFLSIFIWFIYFFFGANGATSYTEFTLRIGFICGCRASQPRTCRWWNHCWFILSKTFINEKFFHCFTNLPIAANAFFLSVVWRVHVPSGAYNS